MMRWKVALGIAAVLLTAGCGETVDPERALVNAEELVTAPPAQVYAELEAALTKVEAASKTAKALTDDTRQPVSFAFERDPGKQLRLVATSGFRKVVIHVFVEPGPSPDETQLRVYFEKKAVQEEGDSDYLSVGLVNLMGKVENELETTGVVKTLFKFRASPRGASGFAECSPTDCG
jgi:hypothetical protein